MKSFILSGIIWSIMAGVTVAQSGLSPELERAVEQLQEAAQREHQAQQNNPQRAKSQPSEPSLAEACQALREGIANLEARKGVLGQVRVPEYQETLNATRGVMDAWIKELRVRQSQECSLF